MMLDGIRILDLSRVIAGPYCATLMADLGADVVKVERPGRGDDLRAWRGDGMSATFAAINRNKRGITVDLQHPEGARLVVELARRASSNTSRAPSGCWRSTVIPRLFRLIAANVALMPSPRHARRSSPRPGRSTLTTSAPRSAMSVAQYGPAMTRERSRTWIPSSIVRVRATVDVDHRDGRLLEALDRALTREGD